MPKSIDVLINEKNNKKRNLSPKCQLNRKPFYVCRKKERKKEREREREEKIKERQKEKRQDKRKKERKKERNTEKITEKEKSLNFEY